MKAGITTASGELLVGDIVDMPVYYDIHADDWREVTQAEVDRWVTCVAAFGMLVTFLRKTDRPVPADLAVEVAQGKVSVTDGFARFDKLLLEHTA